ncbi:MAG TPA: CHAD domain-containing protein [Chitinophagaceae bacterium]|nr:CHAD domain-containing protein [Chitinophagaceae bacterium]
MAEGNLILKNWLQQKDVFIENLIISRKRPTKDSVHDLRVAVKKMRSYLRLNDEFVKQDWRSSFFEIRDLFKCFGKLRDFDMSLELCRKQERQWKITLPAFKEYLSANRSLTRRWTKQAAIKFNEQQPVFSKGVLSDNFQFSFFNGLTVAETSTMVIAVAAKKIRRTKRLKKHFYKNAHEIRKELKDVLYWLKICPKEELENFADIKHLDTTLKYLGNWQDHYIFKRKIRQYSADLASKKENDLFDDLEKKISDQQKELLEKAEKKLIQIESKKATGVVVSKTASAMSGQPT